MRVRRRAVRAQRGPAPERGEALPSFVHPQAACAQASSQVASSSDTRDALAFPDTGSGEREATSRMSRRVCAVNSTRRWHGHSERQLVIYALQ